MYKLIVTGMLAILASGCTTLVPAPAVRERPSVEPIESWARVLERFVDNQGRVNFAALARDRADLDRYVAWIYVYGPANQPQQYPSASHVMAFHLNAYNALAMYNVIESGIPQTNSGFAKVRFFFLRKIKVAGEEMTLRGYENDVIRKLGDPRVHFALNCMSVSCPRLPRAPFAAGRLEQQLERETRFFFSEPRNLRADDAARTVRLSEILDFFPEDFLATAPSLISYVSRYRQPPVPESYKVKFIPYDWTINKQ